MNREAYFTACIVVGIVLAVTLCFATRGRCRPIDPLDDPFPVIEPTPACPGPLCEEDLPEPLPTPELLPTPKSDVELPETIGAIDIEGNVIIYNTIHIYIKSRRPGLLLRAIQRAQ